MLKMRQDVRTEKQFKAKPRGTPITPSKFAGRIVVSYVHISQSLFLIEFWICVLVRIKIIEYHENEKNGKIIKLTFLITMTKEMKKG